jgi:hypothetical protein
VTPYAGPLSWRWRKPRPVKRLAWKLPSRAVRSAELSRCTAGPVPAPGREPVYKPKLRGGRHGLGA